MASHPAFGIDGLILNGFADKGLDLEQSAPSRIRGRSGRSLRDARYSR
jgi:hypothetical protein